MTRRPTAAGWCSGRHTALYRSVCLPDYAKDEAKAAGDLRNHAVDAILLACKLPSAAALENPDWNRGADELLAWREKVRVAAPAVAGGLPAVDPCEAIGHFEQDLGEGYRQIDLSAFNWNRKRRGTHGLDPFGETASGLPLKRVPAADVLADLRNASKAEACITGIAHRGLRRVLSANRATAPEALVAWLQRTCAAGLRTGTMGNHPADVERLRQLREFAETPAGAYVAGEEPLPLPAIIGVKVIAKGNEGSVIVGRQDGAGDVFQAFKADPVTRELRVGYRRVDGRLDRDKPVLAFIDQAHRVRVGWGRKTPELPEDSALRGQALNARQALREYLAAWEAAFAAWAEAQGVAKWHSIRQGCVVETTDGQRLLVRNFRKGEAWMRQETFRRIRRVCRSPLRAISANRPTPAAPRGGTSRPQ